MGPRLKLLLGLLATAQAAQPEAPAPIAAPLRQLPWGQLNFLHSTDTHGWHAGHLTEPSFSADWGDYISFATRLREKADKEGSDLLLIDTGDRIEGNGLYDGDHPKGNHTRAVFKHQHIDVITIGNHELYKANSSRNEYDSMVPNFKGNYIASNLDYIRPDSGEQVPMAARYKKFSTKNQGIRVLAFGFLFDFTGNANNTVVQKVKNTVKEQWFKDAIRDKDVDLFLVAGHVPVRSPEFTIIFDEIRAVNWDTPIVFFGGHTHIRDYAKYDSKAYALESGRYFETIGFQSISGLSTGKKPGSQIDVVFGRRYIDNNLYSYYQHTGLDEKTFPTELGQNVTKEIHAARQDLKLDKVFGCAPQDYWTNRAPYPDSSSIFTWIDSEVVPQSVQDKKRASVPRIVIGNTGAIRFDIFKGPFTKDSTYTVSPFTGGLRYIRDVPYALADRVLSVLNSEGPIFEQAGMEASNLALQGPQTAQTVTAGKQASDFDMVGNEQQVLGSKKPRLTPGYTTTDDAGTDGDDTLHDKITFYPVPNCWESRINTTKVSNGKEKPVETVDLVYMKFVEDWLLLALKFLGGSYEKNSTDAYMYGKDFTDILSDWISDNWQHNC